MGTSPHNPFAAALESRLGVARLDHIDVKDKLGPCCYLIFWIRVLLFLVVIVIAVIRYMTMGHLEKVNVDVPHIVVHHDEICMHDCPKMIVIESLKRHGHPYDAVSC